MKGDGKQVADQIEDWYTSKACDGFNIHVGYSRAVLPISSTT